MPSFRELLQQSTDQVERPRPVADGHYIGEIRGHEFDRSRNKQTPLVRFIMVPLEETTDVADGANAGMELARKELRKEFYITPTAMYRLTDFLDAVLGKTTGRSFDERIPDTRGVRVLFQVTHRDTTDEATGEITNTYNDVGTVIAYGD